MKKRILFGIAALIIALSFIGCPNEKEEEDDDEEKPGPAFTLKVTGIPQETRLTAASLFAPTDQEKTPLAVALYTSGGTFVFYEPQQGETPMPDQSKPYRKDGSYSVFLVDIDLTKQPLLPTKIYMYMDEQAPGQIQLSKDISIEWTKFVDVTDQMGA